MKKEIVLGTLAVGFISLSLVACARKHPTVAPTVSAPVPPAQPVPTPKPVLVTAPAPLLPAQPIQAKRLDYIKK